MEEDDSDVFLTSLKGWNWQNLQPLNLDSSQTHKSYSKQWSMVVIRDSSTNDSREDSSIFPPSNHENLIPSHFNQESKHYPPTSPSSPSSPFAFVPSDFDPSPSPPVISLLPKWWGFAVQILRSRIANIGSYFGCKGGSCGNKRSFWSFGNFALPATVLLWWLCVRLRRKRRRRRKSVANLMQIISEKDKKIMQLLNQIAQMNEVLLARHKVLASKLPS